MGTQILLEPPKVESKTRGTEDIPNLTEVHHLALTVTDLAITREEHLR